MTLTDSQYVAFWAAHCSPVAIFAEVGDGGVQYVFLPLFLDDCDECGLRH